MTFFEKLWGIKDGLMIGQQLSDPAVWKNRSSIISLVSAFLAIAFRFIEGLENVDPQTINDIATGVAGVAGLWNWYFHLATSVKVGFGRLPNKD